MLRPDLSQMHMWTDSPTNAPAPIESRARLHYTPIKTATWLGVMVNLYLGQYTVKQLSHANVFPITLSFCS